MTRALVGRTVADVERDLILETLKHCLGNRTHAANILGISIRTLRNKLNEYSGDGVPVPPPGGGEARARRRVPSPKRPGSAIDGQKTTLSTRLNSKHVTNREVERHLVPLDDDIAGQPAEPDWLRYGHSRPITRIVRPSRIEKACHRCRTQRLC